MVLAYLPRMVRWLSIVTSLTICPNGDRTRKFFIHLEDDQDKPQTKELTAPEDWVIPTGGGYFFAPSISALKDVLTK